MSFPTGTVTFLFTDIEGSTQLWEKHPKEMKAALSKHDSVLKEAIESNHGHIIKTTGDGAHAVFATAVDAVIATLSAQRKLQFPIINYQVKVRMGLHTGEVELREGDSLQAAQVLQQAATLSRLTGDKRILGDSLDWQNLGHRSAIANQLECFAFISITEEEHQRAIQLLGAAEALREKIGSPMAKYEEMEYDKEVAQLRALLNESDFNLLWVEGRALTMDEGIELALEKT